MNNPYYTLVRKENIRQLLSMIEAHPDVHVTKLVSTFALGIGLTEKTVREYLDSLKNADQIEVKQGLVSFKSQE